MANNDKVLIKNGTFITLQPERPVIHGYMEFSGGFITYIGDTCPGTPDQYAEIIDGHNKLYMPGLVNTHGHAAMSLLRGYADDLNLQVWLEEKIWPIEGKYNENDVRYGTQLAILEMLKGGTTSFVDMYDKMHIVAESVEQSGMRARLCRGVIGFPLEAQDSKLQEAVEFAKDWNGRANGRITTMMSPHSPYTCPPAYIERFVQAAHDLDLPLHTHMSETLAEVLQNEQQYGLRPVAHLQKLGLFSRPCLVAHAVHLTDEEIAVLAEHRVNVSHNPGSNLKLASGIARVIDLQKAGVLVSLGTDGAASNNNLDMFEEMRLAALVHKGVSGDPTAVPAVDAIAMGTVNGARSIWLDRVGTLEAGMKADFIALDLDQPHFQPKSNFVSHVIYSASAKDVTDVYVDGVCLVRQGVCLTLDEERIIHEFGRCFERLTQ